MTKDNNTMASLRQYHDKGDRATMTIMFLSDNKTLLRTERGRNLLTHCLETKSKWDEYESLKFEMKMNNPGMTSHDYESGCLELYEGLDL